MSRRTDERPFDRPLLELGEILVSHSKEIERRRASVALLLSMPLEQCLVVASALNAARQRSDPLRATAT